jgi:hypothetical protein
MDNFRIYLYFPTHRIEQLITPEISAENLIEEIKALITLADCEKGADLLFEGSNKDEFIELINLLEIENYGSYNFEDSINILLENAENWENSPISAINEDNCIYRLWNFANKSVESPLPTLKEITESKLQYSHSKTILLNFFNAIFIDKKYFSLFKDCRNDPSEKFPKFVKIEALSDFLTFDKWLQKNRIKRNYNLEDSRHIENHPRYDKTKSPLLGGIGGKQNAANLLITAVGDPKKSKDLINFDEGNDSFIWFEYENDNPQNQYHGYHLVKPKTHEKDKVAEAKIPDRIQDLLNYRKNGALG